jgi:hypothetical protein
MSYNESKTVIRVEIPHLRGKGNKEAYEFFYPILGEPDDVDEWDGEIEYFSYYEKNHRFIPVSEYSYGRNAANDRWGVDLIIAYDNDYNEGKGRANHSLQELNELAGEMAEKFNVDPNRCRLVSYTWYNGGDEPIEFE